MRTPHSLYRCDECRAEVMTSDQDLLQSKRDGWLKVNIHVLGGVVEEHHYCAACTPGVLKRYRGAPPAEDWSKVEVSPIAY